MNIETQINQYNVAKLKRDKLITDSSERNPVVEELNNSLRALKQNIIRAVDNMIVSINVKLRDAHSRRRCGYLLSRPRNARCCLSSVSRKSRRPFTSSC